MRIQDEYPAMLDAIRAAATARQEVLAVYRFESGTLQIKDCHTDAPPRSECVYVALPVDENLAR